MRHCRWSGLLQGVQLLSEEDLVSALELDFGSLLVRQGKKMVRLVKTVLPMLMRLS